MIFEKRKARAATLAVATLMGLASIATPSHAAIITNGDFETGDFTGWTVSNADGGSGSWYIGTPGAGTPLNGIGTPANPSGGNYFAVVDQFGPGAHALTQSFSLSGPQTSVQLSFDMFLNNNAGVEFVNPAGLDYNAFPNQHVRVDILNNGSSAFATDSSVRGNYFLGGAGTPSYFRYTYDITSAVANGGIFDLRFAEVDNSGNYTVGVDNVSITAAVAPVPELNTMVLMLVAMAGLMGAAWMRKKKEGASDAPLRMPAGMA